MDKSKISYIPVIDLLRGIAATSVCLFHFICTTTGFFTSTLLLTFFSYGHYGVQLFFVISGMVVPLSMINGMYKYRNWSRFLLKRFLRIEPPYLIAVLIGTAYLVIRNYIPSSTPVNLAPGPGTVALHLGYLIPFVPGHTWISPVFWTLSIEFQYYLLLSLVFPLALSAKTGVRFLFYALFLGGGFLNLKDAFLPCWLPLFLIGILYVLWKSGRIPTWEYLLFTLFSMILVGWKMDIPSLVTALLTVGVVHLFGDFRNKVAKFSGDMSYSLYLLHSITGAAFVNFFSHLAHSHGQKILVIAGGVVVSVVSAFILNRLVEKPSQKLSSRIKLERS
ncbi:MAG: acyltransferase family protein [Bacteroidia bacterium]